MLITAAQLLDATCPNTEVSYKPYETHLFVLYFVIISETICSYKGCFHSYPANIKSLCISLCSPQLWQQQICQSYPPAAGELTVISLSLANTSTVARCIADTWVEIR